MFDVIGKKKWFFTFSGLITIPGFIFILLTVLTGGKQGLQFTIDYTGGTLGMLEDYYAWEWGDALFVVIDPYWSSPVAVDTVFGQSGDAGNGARTTNKWEVTHGDDQYFWLKRTLEESRAKWKFVFAHHLLGGGRGAVELIDELMAIQGDKTPAFTFVMLVRALRCNLEPERALEVARRGLRLYPEQVELLAEKLSLDDFSDAMHPVASMTQ